MTKFGNELRRSFVKRRDADYTGYTTGASHSCEFHNVVCESDTMRHVESLGFIKHNVKRTTGGITPRFLNLGTRWEWSALLPGRISSGDKVLERKMNGSNSRAVVLPAI